ncbi:MAG TPA: glycosyltransferase, partial [Bryobacteraceae bacterium]|nr:glycosyltransferase [Bryobacteraceae bacterium]
GPFYDELLRAGANPKAHRCSGRYSISWHRFLKRQLTAGRYDVVHLTAPLPNAFLLRSRGLPVVGRLNYPKMNHGWYPTRLKLLDSYCSRLFDAYVVVSKAILKQFVERGYEAKKLHLIYNGITPQPHPTSALRQELGIPDGQRVVGTIGRMRHEKGMDLFLRAAAELSRRMPDVSFVIAGDGPDRAKLEALAESLNLGGKVRFLGFRRDAANVLGGFDVLLYLSRWEAFSNTILEAMSAGVAVVASAVGGNIEAIQHGIDGKLVSAEDWLGAAAAVEHLLRHPSERSALGAAAVRNVRAFSTETMVRKHEALFRALAGAAPSDII